LPSTTVKRAAPAHCTQAAGRSVAEELSAMNSGEPHPGERPVVLDHQVFHLAVVLTEGRPHHPHVVGELFAAPFLHAERASEAHRLVAQARDRGFVPAVPDLRVEPCHDALRSIFRGHGSILIRNSERPSWRSWRS
jgi:hypothetical protein